MFGKMFNLLNKAKILFIVVFLFLLTSSNSYAVNNKFGIHILEPSDLDKAASLVNSSGGDWGYVTVVIRDDDLDFAKWQDFMDQCREKHLVPLVRIATHQEKENWAKPVPADSLKWAEFLNNLNWPVKDRYVIIFNEPNQAKEWGGEIKPDEYAQVLSAFADEFKRKNPDFKILNAGFDLSASDTRSTMDVFRFWQKMEKEVPGIFDKLDAWASHSYPLQEKKFTSSGRFSIRGYEWELATLKKNFGLKHDLPVFITETGFKGSQSSEQIKLAFENFWLKDSRVIAVTPFVLNYPYPPFSEFSWLDKDGNPYSQYELIRNVPKISWWPKQEEKYILEEPILPPFMLTESSFKGKIPVKNVGQSILGEREKFVLNSRGIDNGIEVTQAILSGLLKPEEEGFLDFEIKTSTYSGEFSLGWDKTSNFKVKVFAPSLVKKVELSIWEKIILKLKYYFRSSFNFAKRVFK